MNPRNKKHQQRSNKKLLISFKRIQSNLDSNSRNSFGFEYQSDSKFRNRYWFVKEKLNDVDHFDFIRF